MFPFAPGIYYLRSYGSNNDLNPPSAFRQWVLGEDAFDDSSQMNGPWGIGVTKGKIFVNDGRRLSGFWVLDLERNSLELVRNNKLLGTMGMAVDSRGFKFFVGPRLAEAKAMSLEQDKETGTLLVFDAQDKLLNTVLLPGRPIDVAVWEDRLFITDGINHRVLIVDRHSLQVIGSFGKSGVGDTEFSFPKAIATDRKGLVYVGDTFNGRIKVFNAKGDFVSQYGYRSGLLGGFLNLTGLDVDKEGRVYAVDANFAMKMVGDELQYFDSSKFYARGESVPSQEVKIAGGKRKNALLGYFQVPYGIGDPDNPDSFKSSNYRPVNVAVDYTNTEYFQNLAPPGMHFQYLIWVTSEAASTGKNLSVYAYADGK